MATEKPAQSCDIVMKGGITSGVVYPLALVELSQKYRFANIGGTSAGAMAAAAAAAAEYGRPIPHAGFERLAKVPQDIGSRLLSFFQPTPLLRPLFNIFVAALGAGSGPGRFVAIAVAAICGYWLSALLGVLPGAAISVIALCIGAGAGWIAFGALVALAGLVLALLLRLLKAANTDLVGNDYGLCPGIHQPGGGPQGFTDWLAQLIQEAAGRKVDDDPLTFGDLDKPPGDAPPVRLAMITTSLMDERPYSLPLDTGRFFFKRAEWDRIFPARVMAFLVANCPRFTPTSGEEGEFYYFPDHAHLPLIVAARMSLSFPGLISAVPLWTRDFTLREQADKDKLRRCLFSDGGVTNNFPIQFFDHLFPNSPTFAISLDEYDPKRNYDQVWLPSLAVSGIQLPIVPFKGLGDFLARLLYSAKDWQDNLQSTLPGYRERIVHVVLKPDEGGLNLNMSEATIEKLVSFGKQAGILLRDTFDMDQHRWRRFLVSMARMEQTLDEVALAYEQVPGQFGKFLDDYVKIEAPYRDPVVPGKRPPYSQDTEARVDEMLKRAEQLVELGKNWRTPPTIRGDGKNIPHPATDLRITPKY
jgi:predicted acylesterase/phospholipase RssA